MFVGFVAEFYECQNSPPPEQKKTTKNEKTCQEEERERKRGWNGCINRAENEQ